MAYYLLTYLDADCSGFDAAAGPATAPTAPELTAWDAVETVLCAMSAAR
eukprot:gene3470-4722_t